MESVVGTVLQNLPALILLVLGFVLVLVEMHIPGFGVPGILGVLSLIAGVMLFARSPTEALVITIIIVALLCVALSFVIRSATKGRLAHSKLVLHEVSVPTVSENDLNFFVGRTGEARTALRPSGIAECGSTWFRTANGSRMAGKSAWSAWKATESSSQRCVRKFARGYKLVNHHSLGNGIEEENK